MEDEIIQDVYTFLCGERVNTELLFRDDVDTGVLITCRLRPWKNQPHDGEMILAGGLTVDEALFHAVRSYLKNEWLQLEWSQRARVPGRYIPGTQANFSRDDTRRARMLSSELFNSDPRESTPTLKNGSQNSVQTNLERSDLKLLKRQVKP